MAFGFGTLDSDKDVLCEIFVQALPTESAGTGPGVVPDWTFENPDAHQLYKLQRRQKS